MAKGGFNGFGGGNQASMMKKAQKMQEEFMKMQAELESSKYEATAGGGAVKAVFLGTREFESIEINPEVVDPEDVEMLQDMILAACNEAIRKSDEATNASVSKMQSGFPF